MKARRPAHFWINGKTILLRRSMLAAKLWTSSVTTEALPCTWPRTVPRSRAWIVQGQPRVADRNAALNGREVEWIEANAFDLLRDYASAGQQYDTVVLDPPAFAKSKSNLETALRGYKELNLRALKMLRPGGILVTCSCSYHVSPTDFLEVVAQAARDMHRNLRIVENRTQAKDHPILLTVPKTAYLKCIVLAVSQ